MFDTNTSDDPVDQPAIFRIAAQRFEPLDRGYRATASLYHDYSSHRIGWRTAYCDIRMKEGALVRVFWKGVPEPVDGITPVTRVAVVDEPIRFENLFLTVPPSWVRDRELVERAARLWDSLSDPQRELFNCVFWDGGRFGRYCRGPSSLRGHHAGVNGNLRHSIDSAEAGLQLHKLMPAANTGLLTLACLLHDAGKADECEDGHRQMLGLSDRGQVLGHRVTIVEWVAVARTRMRQGFPEAEYLSLLHCLSAVAHVPAWTGLREPMTPEALLLSHVDRISGQGDLATSQQAKDGGWGTSHPHLGRPFYSLGPKPRGGLPGLDRMLELIRRADAEGVDTRTLFPIPPDIAARMVSPPRQDDGEESA
jgi:3'-5' exoribonuclease